MKRPGVLVCCALGVALFSTSVWGQSQSDSQGRSSRGRIVDRRAALESFECDDGYTLKYRWNAPREIVEGEQYPLVLCLHGAGGSTQAPRALSKRTETPCFVFAPSVSTKEFSWTGKRKKGIPYVFEALDAFLEIHPIDPNRIYVTGQSMGGQGTWGALALRPEFFAAAVPVCGGWKTSDAMRLKDVPIWVFHGAEDRTVPVKYSRDMVKALREAGGSPKYTEYPGVKHNSWSKAYETEELWEWMFAQRRAEKP